MVLIHFADQVGFELIQIHLPLRVGVKGMHPFNQPDFKGQWKLLEHKAGEVDSDMDSGCRKCCCV